MKGQKMMQHTNINQSKNVVVAVGQSLSCVRLFVTPWTAALQTFLSFTISQSLLKFMPIESVMLSNYLILCLPLLLWPSIFSSTRVFSNESALHIRWPKNIIRDKEGHFMILKISIHQENIIALNVYDLNNRDSKYTKLTNYKKKQINQSLLEISTFLS